MKPFCAKAVITLLLYCVTPQAYARPTYCLSYADLVKESDLVVVANAIETRDVPNTDTPPAAGHVLGESSIATLFQQVETTFHVQAIAKGEFKEERLTLVHFRWKRSDEIRKELKPGESSEFMFIRDPASLVEFPNQFFDEKLAKTVKNGPDCILFLKLRKDGKCEPITGQIDPVCSVRWLSEKLREPTPNSQQPLRDAPGTGTRRGRDAPGTGRAGDSHQPGDRIADRGWNGSAPLVAG